MLPQEGTAVPQACTRVGHLYLGSGHVSGFAPVLSVQGVNPREGEALLTRLAAKGRTTKPKEQLHLHLGAVSSRGQCPAKVTALSARRPPGVTRSTSIAACQMQSFQVLLWSKAIKMWSWGFPRHKQPVEEGPWSAW